MSTSEDLYGLCGEPIAILRKRFLFHADNNFCAAFILDDLVSQIASREEYGWTWREPVDYRVNVSITNLTRGFFGLFTEHQVIDALNLLIKKELIGNIGLMGDSDDSYTLKVYRQKINKLSDEYRQSITPRLIQSTPQETEEVTTPEQEVLAQEDEEPRRRRRSESDRVKYHNKRASRVGLPATLTTDQWDRTLDHFNQHCAFCATGNYEVMEHFIPIIHGGGTTEYNCIPACTRCNRIKHDTHPSMIPDCDAIFASLQSVQEYLEVRRLECAL